MSYCGTKIEYKDYTIVAKIHGTLDAITVDMELVVNCIDQLLNRQYNCIEDMCHMIVDTMRDTFCDGVNLLWCEVECHFRDEKLNTIIYGTSAEKLLRV